MERIKQAVELARKMRSESADTRAIDIDDGFRRPPAGQVHYTQTRVVSLNSVAMERNRILLGEQKSDAGTAYRMLRTLVLQKMRENGWTSLAVTSARTGDGKTVTAINLALSLAREVNHTVLLVDLDLRNPSVHQVLGYEPEKDLSHYLYNGAPLQEILFNPGIERLVVLPCGDPIPNSSETLSSPRLVALVDELKNRYPERIVIFDLPPVLETDDPLAFSPYVDAFLFVVEEGKTTRDELTRAMDMLGESLLLGTVLNKSRVTEGKA